MGLKRKRRDSGVSPFLVATLFSFLFLSVTLVPWVLQFWISGGYRLAPDSSKWSEFGGYIGGTLSPLLSFATIIFLGITWSNDRKVRLAQEREASVSYLVKGLEALEAELDIASENFLDAQISAPSNTSYFIERFRANFDKNFRLYAMLHGLCPSHNYLLYFAIKYKLVIFETLANTNKVGGPAWLLLNDIMQRELETFAGSSPE